MLNVYDDNHNKTYVCLCANAEKVCVTKDFFTLQNNVCTIFPSHFVYMCAVPFFIMHTHTSWCVLILCSIHMMIIIVGGMK